MRKLALKELALMLAAVMIVGISLEAQTPVGAEAAGAAISPDVAAKLAQARLATAKYATDLARAKADGYTIITPMIPNMGYHFLNPKISGFDVTKPPILVYVRRGDAWQLGGDRMGLAEETRHGAAPGSALRVIRGGVPLHGRRVRLGEC